MLNIRCDFLYLSKKVFDKTCTMCGVYKLNNLTNTFQQVCTSSLQRFSPSFDGKIRICVYGMCFSVTVCLSEIREIYLLRLHQRAYFGGLRDISRYTNCTLRIVAREIIRHACRCMSNLGFVD